MSRGPWLGVIADDYTGATDLAAMIARTGLRVTQSIGVPNDHVAEDVDCVVIALKSRSVSAADAVADSLASLRWLQAWGAKQFYFKYCSTFDSTDEGNIGPVADALAAELSAGTVVFCPSVPEHGRTMYLGHLFVNDVLLSESAMKDHPINPMRESDVRRLLQHQTDTPVSLLPLVTIRSGAMEAAASLASHEGVNYVVADTVIDADLDVVAEAVGSAPLVTGGAGLAAALAQLQMSRRSDGDAAPAAPVPLGPAVVLAGSCSRATQEQLALHLQDNPEFLIDAYALDRGEDVVERAVSFVRAHRDSVPAVVAGRDPATVRQVQSDLGVERSSTLIEKALGEIARRVRDEGITRIMVAGGESSGAVVNALGATALDIGAEVAPGVPWMVTRGEEPIGLILKSGNLGGEAIFRDALTVADAGR